MSYKLPNSSTWVNFLFDRAMTSLGLDKACHVTAVPNICNRDLNQCSLNSSPARPLRVLLFHLYPLSSLSSKGQPATKGSLLGERWNISFMCAWLPTDSNPSVDDSLHLVVSSKGEHPSKQPCQKSRPCSCYLGQVNLVWNSRLFWICKCYIPICSVLLLPLLTRDFRT